MKRKAATVALLCFLVGFLSLYIYQSVRDLKHEMSIKMQPVKPNAQFQFGYPPTTTWPTVPPSIKAPKPQPPQEPRFAPCYDERCKARQVILI